MNFTGTLIEELIGSMDRDEVSITLALLQKRMCELNRDKHCSWCGWCGSRLCIPVRSYLEDERERMDKEASEVNNNE